MKKIAIILTGVILVVLTTPAIASGDILHSDTLFAFRAHVSINETSCKPIERMLDGGANEVEIKTNNKDFANSFIVEVQYPHTRFIFRGDALLPIIRDVTDTGEYLISHTPIIENGSISYTVSYQALSKTWFLKNGTNEACVHIIPITD